MKTLASKTELKRGDKVVTLDGRHMEVLDVMENSITCYEAVNDTFHVTKLYKVN